MDMKTGGGGETGDAGIVKIRLVGLKGLAGRY
jgi:hypothetical protein